LKHALSLSAFQELESISAEIEGFLRKMFWRVAGLSTTSPVESVLDKDGYTLEELLDEEEIIQECKALNSRLINL
jgi:hypothetical protein